MNASCPRGVDPVHRLARVRQSQREQRALAQLAVQVQPDVAEVDLGLGPRLVRLRDERSLDALAGGRLDMRPALRDVVPHR